MTFPITVGIIGHRDFIDANLPGHEQQLRDVLTRIISQNPHSKVTVISSFAEGADLLGVQVAASMNLEVVAVLPMAQDEYEKDFDDKSLEEFRRLLRLASVVKVNSEYENLERNKLYESCATYVVQLSDICVAFWDGEINSLVGGTYSTIDYVMERQLNGIDACSLIHLHMPRSKEVSSITEPRVLTDRNWVNFSQISQDKFRLEKDIVNKDISECTEINISEKLDYFSITDELASHYQKKFNSQLRLLTLALYLSVLAIEVFLLFQGIFSAMSMIVVVLVTFAYWTFFDKSQLKPKYESLRFLGESLRLDSMLKSAGIKYSVSESSTYESRVEGDSANKMLRWVHFYRPMSEGQFSTQAVTEWITGQIRYLEGTVDKIGAIQRNSRSAKRLVLLSRIAIGFSLAALLLLLISNLVAISIPIFFQSLTSLIWTIGLSSFASILAFLEVTAVKDITHRYKESLITFKMFERQILDAPTIEPEDIKKMADLTYAELFYWYSLKRERKIRPIN